MKCELHHLVSDAAHITPDAIALTDNRTSLTYADLNAAIRAFGGGLVRWGLQREDRVAVYLEKRVETVISVFGASAARGVFVPVNPVLRARQVAYILADCNVRVLVTSVERFGLLLDDLANLAAVVLVGADDAALATARSAAPHLTIETWADFGEPERALPRLTGVLDTDIAAIFYTSGSTGKPKGVVLSHRNLLVGASSVSYYLGNVSNDVILAALPLSFDAGFSQLTTAFHVGAHVVLHNYLLPADLVRACARHRVTALTCVPPLWIQVADQDWPEDASSALRYFANTGGRMPKATLDRLRTIFPQASPFLMYGLTEAFRSTYLDPREVDRHPDSIGKAIPNAEILVVRPDGTVCDPGEEGELVHRGALVALGYWNDAERTAERFRPVPGREADTWRIPEMCVWSGDVVVRDESGLLYFVGRRDEMIKTSGYRVSPSEIEEVAYDSGLVRDAVAIGLDDERLGQRVVLVVAARPGLAVDVDELLIRMRRQLPLYMLPETVDVRDELPRSPNGKFDRAKIRDELDAVILDRSFAAAFGAAGESLLVGGLPLERLAARVGSTPFFAYDRRLLTERLSTLRTALPTDLRLSYAIKANPMPAVVQHLSRLVDSFDVASAAEMALALDTVIPPNHISFAGPGKNPDEIARAVAAGVTIELESSTEASRVARAGEQLGVRPRVAVRVNPDFRVKGSGMRMGGGPQPFGVDAELVPKLLEHLSDADLEVIGFHVFAGSQNLNVEILSEAQRRTADLVIELAANTDQPVRYVNLGGGFGIPYFDSDQPLDLSVVGDNLERVLATIRERLGGPDVVIELGRYIVGECGVYVTRIIDRKESRGRTFLVVDGGLHHQLAASGNFGQVLRRNYPLAIGNRVSQAPSEVASVVGCLCTPLDLLGDQVSLPAAEVGDLVVVFQAGAYGLTASPTAFLSHPRPAEVLV